MTHSAHHTTDAALAHIEALFRRHGDTPYDGARREAVSALEHALQCAQLAEWAQAEPPLVAAALLHDIGHFIVAEAIARNDHVDDAHESIPAGWIGQVFGAAVAEPVRLHVLAKRWLVRAEPAYAATLSAASQHSLALQGGPMTDPDMVAFESRPFAHDAIRLRRWDDLAKVPGRRTPPLDHYLALLGELREPGHAGTGSGSDTGNGGGA